MDRSRKYENSLLYDDFSLDSRNHFSNSYMELVKV